jgi:molybdenum cofactor cytidylyltransferase
VSANIGAVVLAAGRSTRMGMPKMALPWDDTTVIGQVVRTLLSASIREILVVTGGAQDEVRDALQGLPVDEVYNPHYQKGEMLSSLQVGLSSLGNHLEATLVVLGDQPQIQLHVVKALVQVYASDHPSLVVPSYQMRRGHPWLVDRSLWPFVLALKYPDTLRDFLNEHQSSISYVSVDSPTILQDLDTPGDYQKYRPD